MSVVASVLAEFIPDTELEQVMGQVTWGLTPSPDGMAALS